LFITTGVILMLAIVSLFFLSPESGIADQAGLNDQAAPNVAYKGREFSVAGSIVKMVAALALVVAAIYGGVYLLRKIMGPKYSRNGQSDILEVVETAHIGPRKSVSLVRVGGKSVLIGTTDSHIAVLTELDDAQTETALAAKHVETEGPLPFGAILEGAVRKVRTLGGNDKIATVES
jgi:flagellar biosynthetic protein FliO